jgi:hypothetical protein
MSEYEYDDSVIDSIIGPIEEQSSNRPKTKSIIWDENKEHILAACVLKHKAYIRTKGMKKEDKWELVKRDVFKSPAFAGSTPITAIYS